MPYFGCHLSISGGFLRIGQDALSIGADTFQFFTRNPRGGSVKAPDRADAAALCALMDEHGFGPLIAHAPYTINPCSKDAKTRDFALMAMREDLQRLDEFLPGRTLYNFHPGSHVAQGVEKGIELIAETLNAILPEVKHTTVLLEAMSGKGSEVGGRFEELAEIISRCSCPEKMGVCLDTCHVYSAGYDIVRDLDGVLEEFDRVIGLDRLKALHLNDSMTPFGSHKDRHEVIGRGSLGAEVFRAVASHPALKDLPMCLETPQDSLSGWAGEIRFLRGTEPLPDASVGAAAEPVSPASKKSVLKPAAAKKPLSGSAPKAPSAEGSSSAAEGQPSLLFICYPKCTTCQRAKKWLDEQGIACTVRHIREEKPTAEELKRWVEQSGLPLKKFFNTSGMLYRSMELKDKLPAMSEDEQIALLASDGMLVKRPIAVAGGTILLGFREAQWREALVGESKSH